MNGQPVLGQVFESNTLFAHVSAQGFEHARCGSIH